MYTTISNTFTSGTTASASEVNTNFTDLVNGISDGTKDIYVSNATFAGSLDIAGNMNVAGTTTFSGAVQADSTVRFAGAVTHSAAVYNDSTVRFTGGATFSGAVDVAGSFTASAAARFMGAVYHGSTAQFSDAVTHSGAVYHDSTARFTGATTYSAAAYFGSTAQFTGATTHSAAAYFDSTARFTGAVTHSGAAYFESTAQFTGAVTHSGAVYNESTTRFTGNATFSAGVQIGGSTIGTYTTGQFTYTVSGSLASDTTGVCKYAALGNMVMLNFGDTVDGEQTASAANHTLWASTAFPTDILPSTSYQMAPIIVVNYDAGPTNVTYVASKLIIQASGTNWTIVSDTASTGQFFGFDLNTVAYLRS